MPAQPQEIDAQKAALLSAIAQQGSQGQAAFQAEQARRQAAQQAAVAAVAQRANMSGGMGSTAGQTYSKGLQGQAADLGSVYAQDAALSQKSFANSIAQTSAANAAYMDQARAAVPVVNAQTAGIVAQIRAEQQAAREAAAADAEQRQLEREKMAFEREQMQAEREARTQKSTDDATAEAQQSLLRRADRTASTTVSGLLGQAVDKSETLADAVPYVQRLIRGLKVQQAEAEANGQGAAGPFGALNWKKDFDSRDVLRYLYEFYTGKKSPTNLGDFGAALQKEGVDPSLLPGYADYVQSHAAGGTGGGGKKAGGNALRATAETAPSGQFRNVYNTWLDLKAGKKGAEVGKGAGSAGTRVPAPNWVVDPYTSAVGFAPPDPRLSSDTRYKEGDTWNGTGEYAGTWQLKGRTWIKVR